MKTQDNPRFRIDHAPADDPDWLVNKWLDLLVRRHPSFQIVDWNVEYASPYCTYVNVVVEHSGETFIPNGDEFVCDEKMPRTAVVYRVYPV